MFISVVLPAPFSPSRAWTSPGATSKETSSFASTPGKRLVIPRIATATRRMEAGEADAFGSEELIGAVRFPSGVRAGSSPARTPYGVS